MSLDLQDSSGFKRGPPPPPPPAPQVSPRTKASKTWTCPACTYRSQRETRGFNTFYYSPAHVYYITNVSIFTYITPITHKLQDKTNQKHNSHSGTLINVDSRDRCEACGLRRKEKKKVPPMKPPKLSMKEKQKILSHSSTFRSQDEENVKTSKNDKTSKRKTTAGKTTRGRCIENRVGTYKS